jgi:hypothetical protein
MSIYSLRYWGVSPDEGSGAGPPAGGSYAAGLRLWADIRCNPNASIVHCLNRNL